MKKKLILIGSGGHANSCINIINTTKKFKISYLVNKNSIKIKNFKQRFFYSNETTFREVNRVLNNIRNVNTKKYTKIIKPFKSLMIFDYNNKKFKSFLKKILN